MDNFYKLMLSNTYTYSTMRHRIRLLKAILNNRIFGSKLYINPTPEDITWFNSLPQTFLNSINKDNLTEFINHLEISLEKTPVLVVNISFDPTYTAETQIGEFCRKNFSSFQLININYNPSLVAGCALVWNGVSKDYSIKARMAQYRDSIMESFKMTLK